MQRARLYLHTLPHLRAWQVVGRIAAGLRRRSGLVRVPPAPARVDGALRPAVAFPEHDPWNTRPDLQAGHFRFLDRTEALGRPVDWEAAHLPLLWRFNLHYFQYLHLLQPDEREALCLDWIRRHPAGRGVGWHPYPTALRIVHWCRAGLRAPEVRRSLYRQAAFLSRNLETYVYGNHLMENARALVLAGRFFDGRGEAARWLARGLDLYRRETAEQILPDGGHYERSPMYHALMLEGYLDVLNVLPPDHPDRPWLAETARRMTDVLASLTHPDGRLALLNDASHEIALSPEALGRYARALLGTEPRRPEALPETGYFVHRDDDVYLVLDGGAAGPEHLLAHAHADVFSFELSVGGRPLVVDTGVGEYAAGPLRSYARSTRAHSTVAVDDRDQIECWDSFRVARRWAPEAVQFIAGDGRSHFEGTFRGYTHLLGDGIVHRRRVDADARAREIRVVDEVTGRGVHRVDSRIQLHPDVEVSGGGTVRLRRDGAECRLEVDEGTLRWEEGTYCPRFGTCRSRRVAVVGARQRLPVRLSYTLRY